MRKALLLTVLVMLYACFYSLQAKQTEDKNTGREQGKVCVKFLPEYRYLLPNQSQASFGLPELDNTLAKLGTTHIRQRFEFNPKRSKPGLPDLSLIYQIEYTKDIPPQTAAELLMAKGCFQYAEPVFIQQLMAVPTDAYYAQSSYLNAMNAANAWDIQKGETDTTGIMIAVVDTGVRWNHLDLAGNLWQNLGEDADGDGVTLHYISNQWQLDAGDLNGIDNDGNGKIDDLIGWDFMLNANGDEGNIPSDGNGHGTIVAGLADAKTNNTIGVSALPWNVKLMPISCSFPGDNSLYRSYEAMLYACENGADVINYSAGSYTFSQAEQDVVNYIYGQGTIIVSAAGNSNSQTLLYPAAYQNVVGVTSVLNSGVKVSFASYGPFVDVSVPTEGMYSTAFSGSYNSTPLDSYTSYATPVASGLAALIRCAHPDWTNDQVVNQLIASCTDIDAVNPSYANLLGDGILNAYEALSQVNPQVDQQLRLGLAEILPPGDANGNMALERHEDFSLNLKVRNYAFGVSSNNVTYTLSCSDPDITILNNTHYGSLPSDGYYVLSNAFLCHVSPTAVTQTVVCTLTVAADLPITSGSVMTFSILISAGGVFVWEGSAAAGYSGRTIRNLLQAQGQSVYYTTVFPFTFHSFSAVFLSFGMVTTVSNNVTRFDQMKMYNAVKQYLEQGGRLYIEGNDAVGFDLGYYLTDVGNGQSAADVLWLLLGIASAEDGTTNGIDNLAGQPLACTHDIVFTATSQTKLDSMDKFTPSASGAIAFLESNYGNAAIQNYGSYGQKTFVFSYCLAELTDTTSPSRRDSLLARIMQDFTTAGNNIWMEVPNVTIVKTMNSVSLSWAAVPYAQSYRVEASDEPGTGFVEVTTVTQTSWSETGILPKRFYKVIARSVSLN
jgi:serine protease